MIPFDSLDYVAKRGANTLLCELPLDDFFHGGFWQTLCEQAGYDESAYVIVNRFEWWSLSVEEAIAELNEMTLTRASEEVGV